MKNKNKSKNKKTFNKKMFFLKVRDYLIIVLGSAIYAFTVNIFISPNQIAPGGITGIAIILNYLFPFLSIGLMIAVLNIPLFIWGVIENGKNFLIKSLVATGLVSLFIDFFEPYTKKIEYTGDVMLAAIFGGVFMGVSMALILYRGGTTGGTDIIAKNIQKRFPFISIGNIILVTDIIIIVAAIFIFKSLESGLFAAIAIFVSIKVIDALIYGFSHDNGKLMFIITDNPKKITFAITERFVRGVTIINAKGGYSNQERTVIMCAVSSHQVHKINNVVKELDQKAFVIVTTAGAIKGEGFEALEG